jgi:hypothetical protein
MFSTPQEDLLKTLLTKGTPPAAPKLTVDLPDEEFDNDDENSELTLRWSPAKVDDLVSFFSLEFGGPVGASSNLGSYIEIMKVMYNALFLCY